MADNVTLPGTGAIVATDDDGTAQHQYVKLEFGGNGTFTKVATGDPLPVVQTGTHNIGTVTAVTAITNALPAGNNNIGDVDIASMPARTVKWASPSAQGSNIASTTLDSLANAASSTAVAHDNSSNLDLYASVLVNLGSFTSTTGASITLRVQAKQSSDTPDSTGAAVAAADSYTQSLTVGASAKVVVFPMVRLYPEACQMFVTNNGGATLASSGNSIKVRPYNESVA